MFFFFFTIYMPVFCHLIPVLFWLCSIMDHTVLILDIRRIHLSNRTVHSYSGVSCRRCEARRAKGVFEA